MDTLKEQKDLLLTLVTKNVGVCLGKMEEILLHDGSRKVYCDFLMQSGAYNDLKDQQLNYGLEADAYNKRMQHIRAGLIALIQKLEKEDMDPSHMLRQGIHQTIFLVANGADALKSMVAYFPTSRFKNLLPLESVEALYDHAPCHGPDRLVVLTNPKEYQNKRYELSIKTFLDTPPKTPAFYFGPRLEALDSYLDQVYSANSVFSLYARLREMLDYIGASNA